MKNDSRYYRTSHFNLACFLYAKGIAIANIDKLSNTKRADFVFVSSPEVEELAHTFSFAKDNDKTVMIDARKLIYSIKNLKEKLYQDNF